MRVNKIFIFLFALFFSASVCFSQTNNSEKVDEKTADLAITATVEAKELKFEVVPNSKVEFPGKPERKTEWSSERKNLPESVQPGVTYRNIGITLKIVSVFADIDRIVDEALGAKPNAAAEPETKSAPASENKSTQSNQTNQTIETKNEPAKPSKN